MLCGNFFKDHKKYFRPVCIPDEDLDLTNKAGIAVGWGLTSLEKYSQGTSCDFKEGVADSSAIPTKLYSGSFTFVVHLYGLNTSKFHFAVISY